MLEFIIEIQINTVAPGISGLFIKKPEIALHFDEVNYEFLAWGDPIYNHDFHDRLEKDCSPELIVNNLYGHYYYIYINKISNELFIGNSLFSLLPLFYHKSNDIITVSENALNLGKYIASEKICKRFILDTILFNYPLFNNSIYKEINLLPANTCISISENRFFMLKHTVIENLFEKNPVPWRKAVSTISDKFLGTVKKYMPSSNYASSLTGGFDGRTLVSAGIYYNRDFSTYSFGSEVSKDVIIAEALSEKANLPFIKIELGQEYIKQKSLECGMEFIFNSSGTATFARAHYLHAVNQLTSKTDIILTGNFGSEIFRTAHIAGAVISNNLFTLFNSGSPGEAFRSIERSEEYSCLNKTTFKEEWESLKEDILQLPCYNKYYSDFTKNQMFYVFVFEELFRKYFGAEMINQFRYLKNRTPFLDIDFLKDIFKTGLAGIHSDFFEHNPFKRYKGQVLYANIIKKAYPSFGKIITDKGYRPDDLINFFGKVNIATGYLKKTIGKTNPDVDPFCVAKAWETNRNNWNSFPISSEYFNTSKQNNINKAILFKILSLSYLLQGANNQ